MPQSPLTGSARSSRPRATGLWRYSAGALSIVAMALGAACHTSPGSGGDVPTGTPPPDVDVIVDANRDGHVDLAGQTDGPGENGFDAKTGAVMLANLDDDNRDGKPDAQTDGVDGDDDTADLAPISLRGFPSAPDGAVGTFTIDDASLPYVRLFRVAGDRTLASSYARIDAPGLVTFSAGELRAGIDLALEATSLVLSPSAEDWHGHVQLTWEVRSAAGASLGTNAAQIRVAPLLFQHNLLATQQVYYSDGAGYTEYTRSLADGVRPLCTAPIGETGLKLNGDNFDQWTQDFFDSGRTVRPGDGGVPVGMKVVIRSAQPDRLAGGVVTKSFLGPDVATIFIHGPLMADGDGHGYSMNSFGDWDVIPPYDKGDQHYPLGRNIWGQGSKAVDQPDPVFAEFVRGQAVQPELNVDTSWLVVGHVDEMLSWVKSNTPRGWSMLAGSPKLAREMFLAMQAQGHGGALFFEGLTTYDYSLDTEPEIDAQTTIDAALANAELMAESQKAQVEIDAAVALLQPEIGLDDAEIVPIPFLFDRVYGDGLAWQPGTVNMLHVDGRVAVPKPFGPSIDGHDPFEVDLESRLGALGLEVHFADDWDMYHINMGEVHCGTNVSRDLNVAWWETGR